jgi:hypothetical protein
MRTRASDGPGLRDEPGFDSPATPPLLTYSAALRKGVAAE